MLALDTATHAQQAWEKQPQHARRRASGVTMAPTNVTTAAVTATAVPPPPVPTKIKRPVPPGIQTNGAASLAGSPSPSLASSKPPSAKQPPNSASDRAITASTVRPINRVRRDTLNQASGRNSRNSAGMRSASLAADTAAHGYEPPPYVVTDAYVLKRHSGRPPSLIVHMHPTHFRFDGQDGMFQYKSPMKIFLEHVKSRTIPHDLLPYFVQGKVPFYDGCLIVQIHDHKSVVQTKGTKRPSSASSAVVPSSIHNYNQWLTPSPHVPFPKEEQNAGDAAAKLKEEPKETDVDEKDADKEPTPNVPGDATNNKVPPKPKIFTVVLHPTPESLRVDLMIKATMPKSPGDGPGANDASAMAPPATPSALVPPTPTAANIPPPAKRQKREKNELDANLLHAAEGQILLATNAPLMLEPTKSVEETIALLEKMSHPSHSEPPPQPKARKRTVAEMAADEAFTAEMERYMLVLDDRLAPNAPGAQGAGGADGDGPTGAATFEPRFERFNLIEDIKREHNEKKEQEKLKQQENDRKLQLQRQQQQAQQAVEAAQRQAEAERVRREAAAAARENQLRQAAEAQRQAIAARAAVQTPVAQANNGAAQMNQTQHAHPAQHPGVNNGMSNGVQQNAMANGMHGPAQARFQAQMSQAQASSPIIRQPTPQNMSSPMVGAAAMQRNNSTMAASPPRSASVVQNPQVSVPMAHAMSSRNSQQSHPSSTPRMPHATPSMAHATPINRPAMIATPRMTQANSPPAMMAQNSQMGQPMMMNAQAMNQASPQVMAQMAQQRAILQQQQQQHNSSSNNSNNSINSINSNSINSNSNSSSINSSTPRTA
ncbi:Spt20 family domain-containing protein [Trichoderma novae-zelandiae]